MRIFPFSTQNQYFFYGNIPDWECMNLLLTWRSCRWARHQREPEVVSGSSEWDRRSWTRTRTCCWLSLFRHSSSFLQLVHYLTAFLGHAPAKTHIVGNNKKLFHFYVAEPAKSLAEENNIRVNNLDVWIRRVWQKNKVAASVSDGGKHPTVNVMAGLLLAASLGC